MKLTSKNRDLTDSYSEIPFKKAWKALPVS